MLRIDEGGKQKRKVSGSDPVASQSSVYFEVHAGRASGSLCSADDFLGCPGCGDRHVDVCCDEVTVGDAGRMKPGEDAVGNPSLTQRERFMGVGDTQPGCTTMERCAGCGDEPVPVGVRFDDRHDCRMRAVVPQACCQGGHVLRDRGEVDDGTPGISSWWWLVVIAHSPILTLVATGTCGDRVRVPR